MSDPIVFDPLGTITVEFDGTTYTLTRPKMGQWRYFSRKWSEAIKEAGSQLTELLANLDEARDALERATSSKSTTAASSKAKAEKRIADLSAQISATTVRPLYEWNIPWVREVFLQLGDKPLPESEDDWPAWLASDPALPNRILGHWQAHPKASGVNPS